MGQNEASPSVTSADRLPGFHAPWLAAALLLASCTTGRLQPVPERPEPVTSPGFASQVSQVTGQPWTKGCRIHTLPNGGSFIPAMLKAIRSAQKTITWENFVAVDSQPVADFTEAFIERAQHGVRVHVILDHYGCSTYGWHHIRRMKKAGVQVRFYSPWRLHSPWRYNHRTHRRILVVDGRTGFVGGAGLAYAWDGHAEDPSRWRDTMYELHGPVVAQLQEVFNDNWQEVTGQHLEGPDYFPGLRQEGPLTAQSVAGSPQDGRDTIGSTFLLALRAARRSIVISHAYFIPDKQVVQALLDARSRGVDVELLVPGAHTDMPICPCVANPSLRRLLAVGVRIFEFEPCMMHGKLVVVDEHLSIIGSGNIDPRSFFINDENNVLVLDASFARRQLDMHQADRHRSRPVGEADLRLPFVRRCKGFLGRLVQHQL